MNIAVEIRYVRPGGRERIPCRQRDRQNGHVVGQLAISEASGKRRVTRQMPQIAVERKPGKVVIGWQYARVVARRHARCEEPVRPAKKFVAVAELALQPAHCNMPLTR